MKTVTVIVSIFCFYSFSVKANLCNNLFEDKISESEWNNTLKRIHNVYKGDSFLLKTASGRQEVLLLFEGFETYKTHSNSKIRYLVDEVYDLNQVVQVQRVESSINNFMPMADINAKVLYNSQMPKEIREMLSKKDYQNTAAKINKDRRFLKITTASVLGTANAMFATGALAINLPGREILIPLAISASAIYYYHFYRGLDAYYQEISSQLKKRREAKIGNKEDIAEISAALSIKALIKDLDISRVKKSVIILPMEIKEEFLYQAVSQKQLSVFKLGSHR